MAVQRHLSKAPIKEALIDLQFEPIVELQPLEAFADASKGKFDRIVKLWETSIGFEIAKGGDSTTSSAKEIIGFRLDSDARKHVVQARTNGFTFSRLAPYEDWEEICGAAREVWKEFVTVVKPRIVARAAVRYINSMPLPLPMNDFSEYLAAAPQIPATLPQGLSAFVQRVVMVDAASGAVAIVTQALEEPLAGTQPSAVTVFLDIDCFRVKQVAPDADTLWSTLDELRDFKNRIFFEHITERTAELFQ